MCSIACSVDSTTPTARVSARYSLAQSSSLASCSAGDAPFLLDTPLVADDDDDAHPTISRVRASARTLTPAALSAAAIRGRNVSATASCTSSVSAALHTPGRCVLAFSTIACACSRSALASTYTWQL